MLDHPVTGKPVVGLVARGQTRKLANLRARPRTTVVVRAALGMGGGGGPGGPGGPGRPARRYGRRAHPPPAAEIFTACGGTHDDWDTYDRVMAEERRTAVLVTLERVYS